MLMVYVTCKIRCKQCATGPNLRFSLAENDRMVWYNLTSLICHFDLYKNVGPQVLAIKCTKRLYKYNNLAMGMDCKLLIVDIRFAWTFHLAFFILIRFFVVRGLVRGITNESKEIASPCIPRRKIKDNFLELLKSG